MEVKEEEESSLVTKIRRNNLYLLMNSQKKYLIFEWIE